jgi:hypothetical protein
MGVRLKWLKMVSTQILVDTIALSEGVSKVCCPRLRSYSKSFKAQVIAEGENFDMTHEADTLSTLLAERTTTPTPYKSITSAFYTSRSKSSWVQQKCLIQQKAPLRFVLAGLFLVCQ